MTKRQSTAAIRLPCSIRFKYVNGSQHLILGLLCRTVLLRLAPCCENEFRHAETLLPKVERTAKIHVAARNKSCPDTCARNGTRQLWNRSRLQDLGTSVSGGAWMEIGALSWENRNGRRAGGLSIDQLSFAD
jgi:hypothetical protein